MIHVSSPPPKQIPHQGQQPGCGQWAAMPSHKGDEEDCDIKQPVLRLEPSSSTSQSKRPFHELLGGGESPKPHCLRQTVVKNRAREKGLRPANLYSSFSYTRLVLAMLPGQPLFHLLPRAPPPPPFTSGPSWQFYLTVSKPPSGF